MVFLLAFSLLVLCLSPRDAYLHHERTGIGWISLPKGKLVGHYESHVLEFRYIQQWIWLFFSMNHPNVYFWGNSNTTSEMNKAENDLSTFHEQKSKQDVYLAVDTINICISIFIFIGNALVIISVARYRPLQITANVFLANLAVADVVVGIVLMSCTITNLGIPGSSDDSQIACISCVATSLLASGNSLFAVILVAAERLVKIIRTERYPYVYRKGSVIAMISVPWITITLTCSSLFVWNTYQKGTLCHTHLVAPNIFQIIFINCYIILAILTIISLYGAIVYKVVQHKRQVAFTLPRDRNEKWSTGSRRMNAVVILIVGILLTTLVPFISVTFLKASDSVFYLSLREIAATLGYCSSFVNPAIYAWKIPEFRLGFKAILTCKAEIPKQNFVRVAEQSIAVSTLTWQIKSMELRTPQTFF